MHVSKCDSSSEFFVTVSVKLEEQVVFSSNANEWR